MTKFNEGWWNCFMSFANELLLYRKGTSNEDIHIIAVLKEAGISKKEILNSLSSKNYISDCVRTFLENYVQGL